jgi:glycerol-3-phosphate O-acyltransferase / dihydroxyacetone phosphate acyltransferase
MGDLISGMRAPATAPLLWAFRAFCRAVVRFEYRRCEVQGLERLPREGPVLICANHPSALADAIVLQAVVPRAIHPLARSGLFRNPLLRPLLALIGAVPVYRKQDAPVTPGRNADLFERCYERLAEGGVLLIFPEGETHADSQLRPFRTGAARIALGALERNGRAPQVIPVGLNFSELGRFRGSVLVNVGAPLPVARQPDETPEAAAQRVTAELRAALEQVTLNLDSWQDLRLLRRIERFYVLRRGFARQRNLSQRFRSLKRLGETHRRLRLEHPQQVARVQLLLEQFERLCRRVGVRDYQVQLRYTPALVARFVLRSLLTLGVVLPLGLWGALNAVLPAWLTGTLTPRLARGPYQYDTARVSISLGIFGAFWAVQTALVERYLGGGAAALYALSLPPTAMLALFVSRERARMLDNVRVFWLFMRQRDLRQFLVERRTRLEYELARLAQLAKQADAPNQATG